MAGGVENVPFRVQRWLTGTQKLTLAERGVYITVISLIYDTGGPVSRKEIRAWCLYDRHRPLSRLIDSLIFQRKLVETENGLIDQSRCEEELRILHATYTAGTPDVHRSYTAGTPQDSSENKEIAEPRARPRRRDTSTSSLNLIKEEEEDSDAEASVAEATSADPDVVATANPKKQIFDLGVEVLGAGSRSLVGKARKQHGDLVTMEALLACRAEGASEPVEFFMGCLKQRGNTNGADKRSPVEKLYAGAFAAAEEWERREGNRGDSLTPALPLLDGGRSAGGAPSSD